MLLLPLLFLHQVPAPDVLRKLAPNEELVYDATVTTMAKETARYAFTIRLRVLPMDGTVPEWPLQADLVDLTSQIGDREMKRPTFGTLAARARPTGFLAGISFAGNALAFGLPLMSFWLPEDKIEANHWFDVRSPLYGGRVSFVGSAKASAVVNGTQDLTLDCALKIEGESPDQSHMRKFRMRATVDGKDGMVIRADGKYSAADGVINYTLQRR